MMNMNVIEPWEEIKPVKLVPSLINVKRINVFIYLDTDILNDKYHEAIESAKDKFSVTYMKDDEDICFTFMDLFSPNKLILEFLLRRIPILDIRLLEDYEGNDAYKWFEACEGRGIYPKLKWFKRQVGYNNEKVYLKMRLSYSFILMNHYVVYVGDIEKSSMIDLSKINLLFFKNNAKFFKNYKEFLVESDAIWSWKTAKIIFIYNSRINDDVCKDARKWIQDNRNNRLSTMTEYEFVYSVASGVNWKKIIKCTWWTISLWWIWWIKDVLFPSIARSIKGPWSWYYR